MHRKFSWIYCISGQSIQIHSRSSIFLTPVLSNKQKK
uniref:Uncharacterized protein n=1 Tax=Arundo donax TaxID=35708 RepID=A0A0A9B9G1_ARUDO